LIAVCAAWLVRAMAVFNGILGASAASQRQSMLSPS